MNPVTRKIVVASVALGAVFSSAPAAYAAPSPTGAVCTSVAVTDPQVEGSQTGEVSGGPLLFTDDTDPTRVYSGSVTCTVQVNAATHTGADACAVTGPSSTAVVAAAGTCTWATSEDDNNYLCTQVDVDGYWTLYWNASNDPLVEGHWTSDPNASCELQPQASAGRPTFYPSGTITITPGLLGGYQYSYTAFNPPLALWNCPTPSGPSATCTPPPSPQPARNRCGTVAVEVTNNSLGLVTGASECVTGPGAWAASSGPANPGAHATRSEGAFSWTCSTSAPSFALFSVSCTVGP